MAIPFNNPHVGAIYNGSNVGSVWLNAFSLFDDLSSVGWGFVDLAQTSDLAGTYSAVTEALTVTATGALTVDSVVVTAGMRILLQNQTTGFQRGIYTVTNPGAVSVHPILTRTVDAFASGDFAQGKQVSVLKGTANHGKTYVCTFTAPFVLDTSTPSFTATAASVTFSSVQSALAAATGAVDFNGQSLTGLGALVATKETPFTINPSASTTAATAGAAASITGAAGATSGAGGVGKVAGGVGGLTGAGGAAQVTGGIGGATSGVGGAATVAAGAGTAGNSAGGVASLTGGAGQGSAAGGAATHAGGVGGATGAGGAASLRGGAGGASSGTGGATTIAGGAGSGGNANGGAVAIDGGAKNGSGADGAVNIATTAGIPTVGRAGVANQQLGMVNSTVGGVLTVGGNAVAITANLHHVGAGLIKNITVPASLTAGAVLHLIPDAAFTYDATGNIVVPSGGGTATINKLMALAWDGSAWTPSY